MKSWKKALAIGLSAVMIFPTATGAGVHNEEVKIFKQAAEQAPVTAAANVKNIEAYKAAKEINELVDSNTLVIKYSKPLTKSVHKKAGTTLVRSLPKLGYDVVHVPKSKKVSDVLRVYRNQKGVSSITPSVKYKQFAAVQGDPKKAKMHHLPMLNIDKALKLSGKHKVTVAVVDGGVDFKHPDLKDQLLPPYNAADPAKNPVRDLHGTHVAGIIASKANNGIGGHGVNPNAKILPVDVFNGKMTANDFTIAEGILYAVSKGADVINLSLGGYASSPLVEEAVRQAIDSGAIVVAAAGNESSDMYSYPAAYPGVISVGNIDRQKKLSDSSNFGPSVDVVAPGEDIYSTAYENGKGSSFASLTGTSMASPMVAGVVSLLKSKHPGLTSYDIENILEKTATDLGAKGYDTAYANGLVNPLAALSYDVKKLPKQPVLTGKTLIKSAKALQAGKNVLKGQLKTPRETHWYKVALNENEHVQTALEASSDYDYGMDFYFIPEGAEAEEGFLIEHNKGRAGEKEGYLFTAEEKGTLIVGVKDMNGSYNASGLSGYTFTAEKFSALKADPETPIEVKSLPYVKKDFTLFPEEQGAADYDYFTITVDEAKVLSVSLSALPGVNSALKLSLPFEEEGIEGEEEIAEADDHGISKGESLSFKAVPGVKYRLAVTNESFGGTGSIGSILDLLMMNPGAFEFDAYTASANPYELKVEEKQLPEDEDGLPFKEDLEETLENGDMTLEEYAEAKAADSIDSTLDEDPAEEMEDEMTKAILANAIPYALGKEASGFFQLEGDEDYYSFVPAENGIYDFDIKKGSSQLPVAVISEYDKETGTLNPISGGGDDLLSLIMSLLGGTQNNTMSVALKKGETYVLSLTNEMYNISADPYTISSKKAANTPAEADQDENNPEKAMLIKQGTAYKNYFIYPGDTDFYYFKHTGKETIHRLSINQGKMTAADKAAIPFDLRQPAIFSGSLIEDTNGDKVLDEDEIVKAIPFGPNLLELSFETKVNLSFVAKEETGYFLAVSPFLSLKPSLQPYEVKVSDMKDSLKDGDGKVVNHVPQKPISLKKIDGQLGARGYMNAGVPFGDVDHFALNVTKDKQLSLTLEMESGLDGKIEIYNAKGALVQSFDHYGSGDEELAVIHLKKGKYFIEISETEGRASAEAYKLNIK
ncbi:S8 family serine peptidase [Bacillus aerolatus]|uniref:S8 family serine peptidase n=1 Tax=Bacillus aerolatus TaxID=2653354 RepID=A0A6I1FF29_9BACI|nr:S8 family peptidase [Bacillus aerolatus]KAB7706627.1 S8 family serine peptidase [Bacillus aerolatus]